MQALTTAAPALDAPKRAPSWPEFLRAELAPTPGRLNAVIRIVVATTIVVITSMTLEVPFLGISAFVVMFFIMITPGVTTQNSVFVAIAATLAVAVVMLSCALTILISRFTIDYPPLRLGAMALVFFLGMYLSRVFAAQAVGILVALVVFVTQAYVDVFAGGESLVRGVLWICVAIAYSAAVAVAINLILLPADPEPLLRRAAVDRFRAVARALAAARGSENARNAAATLAAYAQQGSAPLLKLVGLAEVRDAAVKPMHAERIAKIHLLERLVGATALLVDLAVEPSSGQRVRLARVAAACESYAAAVSSGTALPVPQSAARDDDAPSALTPVLAELERIVRELPLAERPEADQPGHGTRPFVADAFTNPRHAQFALKTTLAAMFCYIAYPATDWFGIHTCMITCVFVALGSAGATIHKSALRLTGCAIGGGIALASTVFLVPHMTSITALALLVAAVTALAAWIAMGSERTAYAGLQLGFAFYLAVLQGFMPSTDVTEMRDRLVGVVFGVVVMSLIFAYVWPERAGTSMVQSLAATLHRMSELAIGPANPHAVRSAAWQSLAQADRLAEFFAFEPDEPASPAVDQSTRVRLMIDLTRRVLLAQAALVAHRATGSPDSGDANADAAREALGRAVAGALTGVATLTETGATTESVNLRAPLATLRTAGRVSERMTAIWRDGEFVLCEALVERVEALQLAARAGSSTVA